MICEIMHTARSFISPATNIINLEFFHCIPDHLKYQRCAGEVRAGYDHDVQNRSCMRPSWHRRRAQGSPDRFLHDLDPWSRSSYHLIVIFVLFQIAMPKFIRLQTLIDRLNLATREILTESRLSAFNREKHEEERFEKANMDLTKTNLFVNRCMTFMMPSSDADGEQCICSDYLFRCTWR